MVFRDMFLFSQLQSFLKVNAMSQVLSCKIDTTFGLERCHGRCRSNFEKFWELLENCFGRGVERKRVMCMNEFVILLICASSWCNFPVSHGCTIGSMFHNTVLFQDAL